VRYISVREIFQRFCYFVKQKEITAVNCTIAFRASIVVMKPDRFTQHQTYVVFYGPSRIRCILWWIFPEDGKNHDRSERKFKIERKCSVQKPDKFSLGSTAYKIKFKEYKNALKKESESLAKWQAESGMNFDRPPKQRLRKATAILLPLVEYDIEPYKPTDFEKNLRGKVMLTEKGSIIGVGRVDRVVNFSAETFKLPTNKGKT
jgi:hypothetical protein